MKAGIERQSSAMLGTGRRRTRRRPRGGAVIGQGVDGVVHDETLPCKDPSKTPSGTWVTKVLRRGRTPKEYLSEEIRAKLAALDIGIFPLSVCEGATGEFQLYMKYGGLALTEQGYPDTPQNPETVRTALQNLLGKVRAMNAQGLYHNDISWDNVVYSPETGVAYLIDFDKMTVGAPEEPRPHKSETENLRARRARRREIGPDVAALQDMLGEISMH
jgi:hypothetical protein